MSDDSDSWLSLCSFISCNLIDHEKFQQTHHTKKVFECYSDTKIKNEILKWMETNRSKHQSAGKSIEESKRLRDLGNLKYSKADVEGSLKLYTESVICAPHCSRELFLALGNRSAASFRLHNYEDCIADIDYAIENFEDEIILPKLLIRKQDALKKLEKLETVKLPESENNIPVIDGFSFSKSNFSRSQLPSVSREQNVSFPFASSALKLEFDHRQRRRVIANENIEVGEILFAEDPYAFVLLPHYFQSHCQFCSAELKCPLACSDCNDFLFCNQTCFKQAYDTFHKWECPGSRLVLDTGVGFLALRTLLKASQDPFSFHYDQVNDLETHLDDVPLDSLMSFTLTATLLLLYLETYSQFFTSSAPKSVDGVGFRLLKHMFQIVCNAFAAKKSSFEGKLDEDSFETCLLTFSSGLYPSAAMMNHSCDPNIITSFCQNTLIVRAGQQIKKGEEVFNCYGPHYRQGNTEQRKEILKNQFYFDCKCKQCILGEIKTTKFLCLNCVSPCTREDGSKTELKCSSCSVVLEEQQYDELLRKAELLKTTGKRVSGYMRLKTAVTIPPLQKAWALKFGNVDPPRPSVELVLAVTCFIPKIQELLLPWQYILFLIRERMLNAGHKFLKQGDFEKALSVFEEAYKFLQTFLDYSSPEVEICSTDIDSCHICILSWRYIGERAKRTKFRSGKYSLRYGEFLRHSLASYLMGLECKMPARGNLPVADLMYYAEELEEIVLYYFGSWSDEYSYVKRLRDSLVKHHRS